MPHARQQDYNEYIRKYLKRRYDERRARGLAMLGGRCVRCGTTEDLAFDHIDPSTKLFDIADRMAQYQWERIVDELKKCQLLCSSCHGKKHNPAGTMIRRKESHPCQHQPHPAQ
jgi:5-methylcytosine-specific restriction endonuclease McrA